MGPVPGLAQNHGGELSERRLFHGLDITNTAVLAGGDYDYSSTGSAIDFKPGIFNLDSPVPAFDPDHFLVRQLRSCYEHVIGSVRNRACVNTPMTRMPFHRFSACAAGSSF